MKKIVLISSYCDTEEKIQVLKKNLILLEGMHIDTCLISPFLLPEEIMNKPTYFIKTKDNPVLDWPEKSMFSWMEIYIDNGTYRISRTYADYGWAGLFQVKQMSQFALNLEYDQFVHMIYDLKIDSNVIKGLTSEKRCNIYPSKRKESFWKAGLHFMIFDRKNLERFVSYIHLDSYLSLTGKHVFEWLENLHSIFPYNYESEPVEDEIYYYDGHDFYNYSPSDDFSMFIVKDDETLDNLKLMFYNVLDSRNCRVKVNLDFVDFHMGNYVVVDLGIKSYEVRDIEIHHGHNVYNITEKIHQVKHNTLRKHE